MQRGGGLTFNVLGSRELIRTIGLMSSAVSDPKPVFEALIRPTKPPGFPNVIIRKPYTFEVAVATKFERQGVNALDANPWERYPSEPEYEKKKLDAGGGDRVGTWLGSRRPLKDTFKRGNRDHIERVDSDGFEWGSQRRYARAFHEGERYQPWDEIYTPPRPIIIVNDQLALEVARGFQRLVSYTLMVQGRDPSEFGRLRVEP